MADTTRTIQDEINDLIDTLNSDREEILGSTYPEDQLHEYADNAVPHHYYLLAQILMNDTSLGEVEDEGLADGVTDVFKRIQIAIYERLSAAAHEWLREAQEAAEEAEEEREAAEAAEEAERERLEAEAEEAANNAS